MAQTRPDSIQKILDRACEDARGDAELLARYGATGDPDAFGALVLRHGPMVLGVCHRVLGDRHAADDAFQATFLVLVRKGGRLRRADRLAPWLYGVARRTALKARGRAHRRRQVEREYASTSARAAPLAPPGDLLPVLDEELGSLPEKYRAPLVLCGVRGLSRTDAAVELGLPEGTVASRLAHARALLRGRLARRGVIVPAAALGAALAPEALQADVSAALLARTVELAGGTASDAVAGLSHEVLRSMTAFNSKLLSGVALAVILAGGFGAYALSAGGPKPDDPTPTPTAARAAAPGVPPVPPAIPPADEEPAKSDPKPREMPPPVRPAGVPEPPKADEKAPDPVPELSDATRAALDKRGFGAVWSPANESWSFVGSGWLDTRTYPKGKRATLIVNARGDVTDDDLKDLPPVEHPFVLVLGGQPRLTPAGIRNLAGLKNLVGLEYYSTPVSDDWLKEMTAIKELRYIWLDGSNHQLTADGLKHLAAMPNLTELKLTHTGATRDGLKHLAGATNLVSLQLFGSKYPTAALRHLAGLKRLTTLEIDNITDETVRALAEVGLLHALDGARTATGGRPSSTDEVTAFKLWNTKVTDAGLQHFAAFKNLTALALSSADLTDAGLKHLAAFPKLERLDLSSTKTTDAGLKHLGALPALTALELGEGITDNGVTDLIALKGVTEFRIEGTRVTATGVGRLAALERLTLFAPPVTEATLEAVAAEGRLHLLTRAVGAGGRRPAAEGEIVAFSLYGARVEGRILTRLVKLKNLRTLDLRFSQVLFVWGDKFQRARPDCRILLQ